MSENERRAPDKAAGSASPCRVGSHVACIDPTCLRCFPGMRAADDGGTAGTRQIWEAEEFPPLGGSARRAREDSSGLVELVVVLCYRDGTEKRALRAIRCRMVSGPRCAQYT